MDTPLQVVRLEPAATADASVIWLHGLGADGHDFEPIVAELRLPSAHRVRFLFPHAPVRPISINAGMEMRGWYDITDQGLDRKIDESGIRESARAVQRLLDDEVAAGIDSRRIVLAGFSQGGAIALHLGVRYDHTLGGILALSTYLPLASSLAGEAAKSQQTTPILIAHGTHDPLVPEKLGNHAAETLRAAGYDVIYKTYPMEHAVSAAEIADIAVWLKARFI
jgi:phospholipase/carboxylesterase